MWFPFAILGLVLLVALVGGGWLLLRLVNVLAGVVSGYQVPNVAVDAPDAGIPKSDWIPDRYIADPTDGLIADVPGFAVPTVFPYVDPWSIDPTYEPELPESVFDTEVDAEGIVDLGIGYEKLGDLTRDEGFQQ